MPATLREYTQGGFGMVYKGTYKGAAAAVKVMYARQHERQAMKDALEMAVLSTISHPNIIQVRVRCTYSLVCMCGM